MPSAVLGSGSRPSSSSSNRAPSPAEHNRSKRASMIPRTTNGGTPQRIATPQQLPLSPPPSMLPIAVSPIEPPTTPIKVKARRSSSFDKLAATPGVESLIPRFTPRRASSPGLNGHSNGLGSKIPEGVPLEFFGGSPSLGIPVSSVGHARTLADEYQRQQPPSPITPLGDSSILDASITSSALLSPLPSSANTTIPTSPSPGYRRSLVGGGTTKVLADLQAHTLQVKSVLENTKSQLRSSQRTIAQLTRQTEDLKDGRERLRLENESLNNVVTRKERLLQELLDRARKAEGEAQLLKSQLKNETTVSKKSLKDMETTLAEAKAVAQRSEREYVQLRDTLTSMREGWRREVEGLREQMRGSQSEAQEAVSKQQVLLKLFEEQRAEREKMDKLHAEYQAVQDEFAKQFKLELASALEAVEGSARECDSAGKTASHVADELARLQRLIKAGPDLD